MLKQHKPDKTHEEFQLEIAASLLAVEAAPLEQVVVQHTAARLHIQKAQPRCKFCTVFVGAKAAKRTWNYCVECQVPLCAKGPCFRHYHDEARMYNVMNSSKVAKQARIKRKQSAKQAINNKKTIK